MYFLNIICLLHGEAIPSVRFYLSIAAYGQTCAVDSDCGGPDGMFVCTEAQCQCGSLYVHISDTSYYYSSDYDYSACLPSKQWLVFLLNFCYTQKIHVFIST